MFRNERMVIKTFKAHCRVYTCVYYIWTRMCKSIFPSPQSITIHVSVSGSDYSNLQCKRALELHAVKGSKCSSNAGQVHLSDVVLANWIRHWICIYKDFKCSVPIFFIRSHTVRLNSIHICMSWINNHPLQSSNFSVSNVCTQFHRLNSFPNLRYHVHITYSSLVACYGHIYMHITSCISKIDISANCYIQYWVNAY